MQIALLSCYEALLDGLTKACANLDALEKLGWGQAQYDALQQKLGAIRSAEQAAFAATATLDSQIAAAKAALITLSPLLVAVGSTPPQPEGESSLRYSVSLSNSSSFPWTNPSGGVWVTGNSSYRVPNGCPGASSSSGGDRLTMSKKQGTGPGKFANRAIKNTARPAPKKKGKR